MQISSRFTIAVHILICVDLYGDEAPATSETLAGSSGVHPVVVRRILGQLRRAGLITVARGREGGAHIARPLAEITLPSAAAPTRCLTAASPPSNTPWSARWRERHSRT